MWHTNQNFTNLSFWPLCFECHALMFQVSFIFRSLCNGRSQNISISWDWNWSCSEPLYGYRHDTHDLNAFMHYFCSALIGFQTFCIGSLPFLLISRHWRQLHLGPSNALKKLLTLKAVLITFSIISVGIRTWLRFPLSWVAESFSLSSVLSRWMSGWSQ